jgi:hypothetical protein
MFRSLQRDGRGGGSRVGLHPRYDPSMLPPRLPAAREPVASGTVLSRWHSSIGHIAHASARVTRLATRPQGRKPGMMDFIDTAGDVIALKMDGKITDADLQLVMDRLEALLASHEKVHVFVETKSIDGIELSSLPGYAARAMPLLGKLSRFGRIAIVADQAWIRVGARIESALLPFISYRTFTPDERDEALAWVSGRSSA